MLSVLVRLTDTVSKHNATKHNFEDNLCYNKKFKYTLITFFFTYHFILSCEHDNIRTVLLSRYHDIDNIVTSIVHSIFKNYIPIIIYKL